MGILGLLPYLRQKTKHVITKTPDGGQALIRNKFVAIDLMNRIYKLLYLSCQGDRKASLNEFRRAFEDDLRWFLRAEPQRLVVVMDGKAEKAKHSTVEKRKDQKQKYQKRAEDMLARASKAEDKTKEQKLVAQAQQFQRLAARPETDHFRAVFEACAEMQIEYVVAEGEGEKHCVRMGADVIVTDDSDVVPMIGDSDQAVLFRARSAQAEVITPKNILQEFDWTGQQLTDFCVFCGTDVSKRVPQVGPARARALVNKFDQAEGGIESLRCAGKHAEEDLDVFLGTLPIARSWLTVQSWDK